MVCLVRANRLPGHWPKNSVSRPGVVTVALQLRLHIDDHPVGAQVVVAVNGTVVGIVVSGSISQRRKPEAGDIPRVPATAHEDDPIVVTSPPITIVRFPVIIPKRVILLAVEALALPIVAHGHVSVLVDRKVPFAVGVNRFCVVRIGVYLMIDRPVMPGLTLIIGRQVSLMGRAHVVIPGIALASHRVRMRPRRALVGPLISRLAGVFGRSVSCVSRGVLSGLLVVGPLLLMIAATILAPRRHGQRETSDTY